MSTRVSDNNITLSIKIKNVSFNNIYCLLYIDNESRQSGAQWFHDKNQQYSWIIFDNQKARFALIILTHPLGKVSHNTKNRNCSIVTCTTVNQYSLVYVYMSVQCACYADALLIASSPITSGQYTYIHIRLKSGKFSWDIFRSIVISLKSTKINVFWFFHFNNLQ